MYERSSSLVLHWLKVPPEPHPPFGDPASLRVFRAGKNYFNFKLAGWAIGQAFALAAIIFWAVMFIQVEAEVRVEKSRRAANAPAAPLPWLEPAKASVILKEKVQAAVDAAVTEPAAAAATHGTAPATPSPAPAVSGAAKPAGAPATPAAAKPMRRRVYFGGWQTIKYLFTQLALTLPPWAFPVLWVLKITGFVVYLVQVPFTYAIMRLDYEMRWYVVTDRSLRIRTGVWSVQELTMSFANLQQVVVTRGPIQGLLKISDLRVQSAGGGGGHSPSEKAQVASLHTGHFHGVDNADEIRDLILARLKHFREAGLGDPEEVGRRVPSAGHSLGDGWSPPRRGSESAPYPIASDPDLLAAARELAAEAKALRVALG